jgi:dihydropteroate synthase
VTPPAPSFRGNAAAQRLPHGGRWRVRGREIALDHPIVVGILNVTPDSFSDGGRFVHADAAVEHGMRMVADGADVIDIGGESTRPHGARPVSAAEERQRVLPVVRELAARAPGVVLSIDTVKGDVAEAALDAGAHVVNDVSGFRLDRRMAQICAATKCGVVLMHSRGGVSDMATYEFAVYEQDVVEAIRGELEASLLVAREAGVDPAAIVLDPGIGFAKRSEHSLAALAGLPSLTSLGHPVLVGVSRKRFIGELTNEPDPAERVHGTTGANVAALLLGAQLFRVHDVRAARQSLDVAYAVLSRTTGRDVTEGRETRDEGE